MLPIKKEQNQNQRGNTAERSLLLKHMPPKSMEPQPKKAQTGKSTWSGKLKVNT